MKTKLGLLVLVTAYALLIPGLIQPMLTLTGTVDKAEMVQLGKELVANHPDIPAFMGRTAARLLDQLQVEGDIPAYEKTRSILGTVKELADSKSYLVAFLIMLFSVIVPITKGVLILITYIKKQGRAADLSRKISNIIGKWSMADVFVVAIIVAFMAANATQHSDEIFTLSATFEPGFYFFLSYCLLSILSAQLLGWPTADNDAASNSH